MSTKKKVAEASRWRLIPRVQDIGFFQGLMVSRRRLVSAALLATGIELGVVYVVSSWMRTASGSPMANVLIIALMLTGLIVAAYLDALVVGDLFFPGRWRERVLLGKDFVPQDWEEEQAVVKEYNAPFFAVFIALLLGLAWVSQLMTNHFLSYYQNLGFALAMMRSEDPADRMMGLEEIANPLREAYWQDEALHEQLKILVRDPDPEVQAKTCYVSGRLQVVSAADEMVEVLRESEDAKVRGEAAMGLGRLEWVKGIAYLTQRLRDPALSSEERRSVFFGLAMMGDKRGGASVEEVLSSCQNGEGARLSEEEIQAGFYALKEMAFTSGSLTALSYAKGEACGGEVSWGERCAASDALRYIAVPDDVPALKRVFSEAPSDQICDYAMWRYHEEKGIEIVEKEPYRAKLLRAVGNQKDEGNYEWIWAVGDDKGEHMTTRKVAETYARGMLEAHRKGR